MVARSPLGHDERTYNEIKRVAHSGLNATALLTQVATLLRSALAIDASCATTTDPISKLITGCVSDRETADPVTNRRITDNYFANVYLDHDYQTTVSMLRTNQSITLLSEATQGELTKSGRYVEHLAPRGLGHEIYATLTDHGLWGELHLTRDRHSPDFTGRDVELVRRIAPHLGAGLRAAALRSRMLVDATQDGPGVVVLAAGGKVLTSTSAADRLLRELGGLDPNWRSGGSLPVPLQVVLAALERSVGSEAAPEVPRLRVQSTQGRWLTLHASLTLGADGTPEQRVVIIAPAEPQEVIWFSFASYGLTAREEDVVKLVVRGLSTAQIADRLFIAEHTVQRHISNIFEKVGVRGRQRLVKKLFVEQMIPNLTETEPVSW